MRRAVGGLLVVVAMAAMTTGAALGASSSSGGMTGSVLVAASTPEELCDLLARGADSRVPWSLEGAPGCLGQYGPDTTTSVDVYEFPTAADALRRLNAQVDLFRESQWPRSSVELGETGYEFDATGLEWEAIPDFELGFVRGPYWVIVRTYVLGGGSKEMVRRLAEEIDQNIEALLGGGTEPESGQEGSTDGETSASKGPDLAGLFFGDESTSAFEALGDLTRYMDCEEGDWDDPDYPRLLVCEGAETALDLQKDVEQAFKERFPEPTEVEVALGNTLTNAVLIGALEGKDGQPLFPSVLGSIDIIEKLVNDRVFYTVPGAEPVPAARRFLEMLMALDAGAWERRFAAEQ